MDTVKGQPLETVADFRSWLEPLRDEQRIKVDIELLDDVDMTGCAQHQLAGFIKDGGNWGDMAIKEWERRYGFIFPQYATGKEVDVD